ncbi:MAG: hypothetical protein BZ137_03675 [Methanosphaera sp. rholeuAM130]|nr:MAG: hypothetical protein BZ137_03675 [Methanosphaera sp. rholeuAM130]
MEIDNILDALAMDGVEEIVQYCNVKYNDETIEFRLINDDIGVIDEIEYKIEDEWTMDYDIENANDSVKMMINAIEKAPFEVFHKSDVGAKLKLNHQSIKEQMTPEHFKTEFYVDNEGPIEFTLEKNVITLD